MTIKTIQKILYLMVFAIIFSVIFLNKTDNYKFFTNKTYKQDIAKEYSLFISIEDNRIYLLKENKLIKSYPCATGKTESPSPLGLFKITKKSCWGEGFGGSWMGLNCDWGMYGIHGTMMPETVGYSLSHGCFRMLTSDASELYNIISVGTLVYISGGCYGAFGSEFRPIGPGMYGSDVKTIQLKLKKLGYYNGTCNGSYNADGFNSAVHMFQEVSGIIISDTITYKMFIKMGLVLMD
jgi:hypothetical protein